MHTGYMYCQLDESFRTSGDLHDSVQIVYTTLIYIPPSYEAGQKIFNY